METENLIFAIIVMFFALIGIVFAFNIKGVIGGKKNTKYLK